MNAKYFGRILAGIGAVLLLSAPFTWFISTPTIALGKVIVGALCLVAFLATNYKDLGQFASSRGTFFVVTTGVGTLLLVAILGFANFIVVKNPKSWDLTQNKIHTLSPDTTKTLEGLKEDVTAFAVYKAGEPGYDVLNDLFQKYAAKSAHFKYEFVDYVKDPLKVNELQVKEAGPRVVVKLGKTESRFGATPQELSEEALTNAIVKVTHSSTKKLYFTVGHGETELDNANPDGLSEVKKRMENEGLKAEKLNLAGISEIPTDAQAVVVAGPLKEFQPQEVELLKGYLDAGGSALVMVEPAVRSGLEGLLKAYNVEADDTVVVDPVSRLFGAGVTIPVVQNYNEENDITRGFHLNTVYPTARPLTILHEGGDPTVKAEPLALSMPSAWGETTPSGQVQRDDSEKGGPFPLVVAVTKDTKANPKKKGDEARLLIAGDRDFPTNKYRNAFGNEDFYLNCLNWLSNQGERITIRPRLRDASRLYLTDTQKAAIFFLAIDILPVTLLAVGLSVWLVRRSK